MADRKALCLVSGSLEEIRPVDRLLLPGDPDFDLHAASKRYVDRRFSHSLAIGEGIYPRADIATGTVASTTQVLRLVYFTSQKSFLSTQVRVISGTTAAGATPTLCELGLFTIDAAGDGTRVALIANDTALFATINTTYTRSWIASYDMVIGQRYAMSWLVVTTAAVPTYTGANFATAGDVETGISPRLVGRILTQPTTPASFPAASVVTATTRPYGVILP